MSGVTMGPGSLVLYKTRPARVASLRDKRLEIELEDGGRLKVRPKDVDPLHPGPLGAVNDLQPCQGEIETAWELLSGATAPLSELAELAYGAWTPSTAWAAWQVVDDGLYFSGTPTAVIARSPEAVAEILAGREARAAQKRAWDSFVHRVGERQLEPEDEPFIREVEDLALGRRDKSRLLHELGRTDTPENAHTLLIDLGYWDETIDPYPARAGLSTSAPDVPLPPLPEESRRDLTHLPAFAIDDEGNREPDDALSVDGDRLWVHVADVAALVPPGSPTDLEARARGAALYLPEGTAPMLPWAAIERLGLGLAPVSPALSLGLDLGPEGEVVSLDVTPSWVAVTRLTYEEAEARLEEEPFRSLHRLAGANQARRQAQGAIRLDLPEVRIDVVASGAEIHIRPIPSLRSRDLVTEAMLLAGEAVGRFALERGLPLPYTTQDPPDRDERPDDLAGMFALRRAMRPSEYRTVPGAHAGLGLGLYVQATSPLRRYLDLVVHQQLRAYVRGESGRWGLLDEQAIMERVGAASAVTGNVRRTERLARRHWIHAYLLRRPGWRGQGILVEMRGPVGVLLVPDLDLEVQVHLGQALPLNTALSLAMRHVNLATLTAHAEVERQGRQESGSGSPIPAR